MGDVASDSGAGNAALVFFETAIEGGAFPGNYWRARAALVATTVDLDRAATLAASSDHPLARAVAASVGDDASGAIEALEGWATETPADIVIRAAAVARHRYATGALNAAIAFLAETSARFPEATGLTTTRAEQLMARAQSGLSVRPGEDLQLAHSLALRARNERRMWHGRSADAALIAVRASGLLHDYGRAFALTQPPPSGDATHDEASDPQIVREAAALAIMTGRDSLAVRLADESGDAYSQSFVAAIIAARAGDADAPVLFDRAFDEAPGDVQRMQVAQVRLAHCGTIPDLDALEENYPTHVEEMRLVAGLPQAPTERLSVLRNRAHESARLTVELASAYVAAGDERAAGDALRDGGSRWSDPILMRMAAAHYEAAGEHEATQSAAEAALRLAPRDWGGEADTRKLLVSSLHAQGKSDEATQEAGRLLALDPQDLSARWAYIYCLARQGDLTAAWIALTPDGDPIPPRDRSDVRAWVSLLTEHDTSANYLRRILDIVGTYSDDEEIVGMCMAHVYTGLERLNRNPAADDLSALHEATEAFLRRFPDSTHFAAVTFDPEDPLAPFAEGLQARHDAGAQVEALVAEGRLPVGFAAGLAHSTYAEALLTRTGGMIRSHDPTSLDTARAALVPALEAECVIDMSAVATLATLRDQLADALRGRFRTLISTDVDRRDAHAAQTALGLRSSLSVGWNPTTGKPQAVEIDADVVELLATRSKGVVEQFSRFRVVPHATLTTFTEFDLGRDREPSWIASLDYAVQSELPFWCDDLALRSIALERDVPSFGTADLVHHLAETGHLNDLDKQAITGILLANFHVDLGLHPGATRLAAAMDNWRPQGAAFSLSRPFAWTNADEAIRFLLEALSHQHEAGPSSLIAWLSQAAVGVTRGRAAQEAASNLRVVLANVLQQPWLRPDHMPAVLIGIRAGIDDPALVADPLRDVLSQVHAELVRQWGHPAATALVLNQMRLCDEQDRQTATEIVLLP